MKAYNQLTHSRNSFLRNQCIPSILSHDSCSSQEIIPYQKALCLLVVNLHLPYGEEFLPVSPATEGRIGLCRILASVSNEDLKDKLKNLLSVKPEDLKDAAERIFQNSSNTKTTIIGDKALKKYAQNKAKKTSVIVKLPL